MKPYASQIQPKLLEQALALHRSGKIAEAKALYQRLLMAQPRHADIWRLLGNAECTLGHWEAGLEALQKSLKIAAKVPETNYDIGVALSMLGRHEEALVHYSRAIALRPNYSEAHYNRANSLKWLRRYEDAIESYTKAVAARPNYKQAHFNRAKVHILLGQVELGVKGLADALAIDPSYFSALQDLGNILLEVQHFEDGLAYCERAIAVNPDAEFLHGAVLCARGHLADWKRFDCQLSQLVDGIRSRKKVALPFEVMALADEPDLHRLAAEIAMSARYSPVPTLPPLTSYGRHDRIRIGYFSTDFGNHPVTHLLTGMFERHDRSKFEIYAFSFGVERQDSWRERVVGAVDHFLNVTLKSEQEITAVARSHEIDIAIDLNGYTSQCLPGIFVERAAPVQASYIGYLGTMATPCMDYLIADPIMVPKENRRFFSEKIAYLHSYQCNDDKQSVPDKPLKKQDFGLPENAFVFCSFNNNYKILPETFDIWMRILKAVPGSVLWLYASNGTAIKNLKSEAEKRGVDSSRIVFAAKVSYDDHIARQRLADLFLDTHPYNAGATASVALRAGLPILTRLGESFAARMGASLLTAVGLPEIIAKTPEEYEALAINLATHPDRMASIRRKLADNLPTCALFDTERFTRNMEAAYIAMYERNQKGLPPDHIDVSAM